MKFSSYIKTHRLDPLQRLELIASIGIGACLVFAAYFVVLGLINSNPLPNYDYSLEGALNEYVGLGHTVVVDDTTPASYDYTNPFIRDTVNVNCMVDNVPAVATVEYKRLNNPDTGMTNQEYVIDRFVFTNGTIVSRGPTGPSLSTTPTEPSHLDITT